MKSFIIFVIVICFAVTCFAASSVAKPKPTDMEANLTGGEKNAVKQMLKDQRKLTEEQAEIIKNKLNKRKDLRDEMLKLHNLDLQTYRRGGKSN